MALAYPAASKIYLGMDNLNNFTQPRLYVLDGGKALTAAVKKHAGESADL